MGRGQGFLKGVGKVYCGRPDKHPYEFFLQLEDIEHRTTEVGRPQSNLQPAPAPPWPRHGGADALRRLQGRDPPKRTRQPSARKEAQNAA